MKYEITNILRFMIIHESIFFDNAMDNINNNKRLNDYLISVLKNNPELFVYSFDEIDILIEQLLLYDESVIKSIRKQNYKNIENDIIDDYYKDYSYLMYPKFDSDGDRIYNDNDIDPFMAGEVYSLEDIFGSKTSNPDKQQLTSLIFDYIDKNVIYVPGLTKLIIDGNLIDIDDLRDYVNNIDWSIPNFSSNFVFVNPTKNENEYDFYSIDVDYDSGKLYIEKSKTDITIVVGKTKSKVTKYRHPSKNGEIFLLEDYYGFGLNEWIDNSNMLFHIYNVNVL